jgi:hypothetical protein
MDSKHSFQVLFSIQVAQAGQQIIKGKVILTKTSFWLTFWRANCKASPGPVFNCLIAPKSSESIDLIELSVFL